MQTGAQVVGVPVHIPEPHRSHENRVRCVSCRLMDLRSLADRMRDLALLEGDSVELQRTKRLFTTVLWISLPMTLISSAQLAIIADAPEAAFVLLTMFVLAAGELIALTRSPATFDLAAHVLIGAVVLVSAVLVVMAGGLVASAVNSIWGLLAVVGSLAVFGDRRATIWTWVFVASQVIAVGIISPRVEPLYEVADVEPITLFNLLVVVLFVFYVMRYYVQQRAMLLRRSDTLLYSLFPTRIAERLKDSDESIAEQFDSVSILFADIVDFTPLSAGMSAAEVVATLDDVFTAIDDLVDQHGLEKIKTVGDEYMVAAGVPTARLDHAAVLCDLALDIRDLTRNERFNGNVITLRIGINSGPVVAGIIGTKKFSYDLWGDTVNTASRMESTGVPGEIQISDTTRGLIGGQFTCEERGVIDVKGKGPSRVWTLTGKSP